MPEERDGGDGVADGWAEDFELLALHGARGPKIPVVPASRHRAWMADTPGYAAKYCLPLLMANQAGWWMLNPVAFTAVWDGGSDPDAVTVSLDEPHHPLATTVRSTFGAGILSWQVPYLFRTPAGFDLLARGPANSPKDGVSPLEGLVETDWSISTFTMNWKLTRPGLTVRFEREEPFCMVVPQRRADLEAWRPAFGYRGDAPETSALTRRWKDERHQRHVREFVQKQGYDLGGPAPLELQYLRGVYPDGRPAPAHRTGLRLHPFTTPTPEAAGPER
jgi:hypothetical protein